MILATPNQSPLILCFAFSSLSISNIVILIFYKFICDDLAILCVNLVNFGPVTPEFKRVAGLHLSLKNYLKQIIISAST